MKDIFQRSYSLEGFKRSDAGDDGKSAEYEFKLSSEEPVEVWRNEFEVLDHSPAAVDMSWIGSKNAPLLYNHDRGEQIGVVTGARLEDGFLIVSARFGGGDYAQQKQADVDNDILRNVSVGYRVHDWEHTESKDGKETFTVRSWTPLEASLVTIPADKTVGFGRSEEHSYGKLLSRSKDGPKPPEETKSEPKARTMENAEEAAKAKEKEITDARSEGAVMERERVKGIQDAAKGFRAYDLASVAATSISEGETVEQFNQRALAYIKDAAPKLNQTDIGASKDEKERYSLTKLIDHIGAGDLSRGNCDYELKISDEIKKRTGKENSSTIAIPHDVLLRGWVPNCPKARVRFADALQLGQRDLISVSLSGGGQSDTVSNIVETDLLDEMFVESLRETSVLLSRGVIILPDLVGDVDIPIELVNPTFAWIAEDGTPAEGTYDLGKVSLAFKTIAAQIPFTRRAEKQSTPPIEALMTRSLRIGAGLGLEDAAWNGAGTATEPEGILNTAGVGSVTTTQSYARSFLVDLRADLGAANAPTSNAILFTDEVGAAGYVKEKIDAGSGQFVASYTADDPSMIMTAIGQGAVTNLLNQAHTGLSNEVAVLGDPSSIYMGIWGTMELGIDTSTKAASGGKVIRVFLDADVAIPQPARWSAIKDL